MASTAVDSGGLSIPLINFGHFLAGDPELRLSTATKILDGFRDSGFVYLHSHGIPQEVLARTFGLSAHFFALPQARKEELAWTTAEANRGYTGFGVEKVSSLDDRDAVRALPADLKESLEIGREGAEHPNRWPGDDVQPGDGFRASMLAFFRQCAALHTHVMRAIATALAIPADWFDEYTSAADNTLRLLHYPPAPHSVFARAADQVRAGAHSDYGSITLLFQDARGGLQVQSPSGAFVDATPLPGTVVVNAGDLLARWSNDVIRSTVHRVVEPPLARGANGEGGTRGGDGEAGDFVHPARYSIAYFCNPNFDRRIDVIPSTVAPGHSSKYDSVNSGEYLVRRLTATY